MDKMLGISFNGGSYHNCLYVFFEGEKELHGDHLETVLKEIIIPKEYFGLVSTYEELQEIHSSDTKEEFENILENDYVHIDLGYYMGIYDFSFITDMTENDVKTLQQINEKNYVDVIIL